MGIKNDFKKYEEDNLDLLNIDYDGLNWCELGNQDYYGEPAKKMYELKGVNHTSIDINGKDESLPLDLDSPIPNNLKNKFNVVTNYGTSEHVNNQYELFKSIHMMCKRNGIMIHGVPLIGNWPKHCRYYYSKLFFEELSKLCDYQIADIRILDTGTYKLPKNLVVCVLIKKTGKFFISKEKFDTINDLKDSRNMSKTGNYTKKV